MRRRDFLSGVAALSVAGTFVHSENGSQAALDAGNGYRWYRGSLHTHTLWSDGDALPEVVVSMYRELGYDFVILTDHDVFAETERWKSVDERVRSAIRQAEERGDPMIGDLREVNVTTDDGKQTTQEEVRLAKFDELARAYNKPGEFLLVPGEELDRTGISTDGRRAAIHMNIFNITTTVPRATDELPTEEGIRTEVRRLLKVGEEEKRLVAVQLNHPTWVWFDNRAEEIAAVDEVTLLEPFNLTPTTNRLGTKEHESADRIWDIVNTLRLSSGRKIVYATASDDAHQYRDFSGNASPPGRGWVMIRAKELSAESLLTSLVAGDFYASSGVLLRQDGFDPATRTLTVEVEPKPDTEYTIRFIGTKKDCPLTYEEVAAPNQDGTPGRPNRRYDARVGAVLQETTGTKATYTLTDEWFVRAHIVSNRTMSSPPAGEATVEEAWTQPRQ